MDGLFDEKVSQSIINRINNLQPTMQPRWGKMNASQMMAHCCATFEMYFGTRKTKRSFAGIFFGGIAKKKLFNNKPWPKSLPTAKELVVADEREFEKEKEQLISYIQKFLQAGPQLHVPKHPFFGKMSANEWAMLAQLHLNHHLKQFGV